MVPPLLALSFLPPIVGDHLAWWVGGLIVVLGLGVYGFRDLKRFSLRCVFAVADVAFKESIRRKVLWITPVAMLSILGLSLIIQAVDPADAIRQLNKFCYFATGVTVMLTAIVLSCTNLPRDMESKVIFTVVTKPATRLEILLGKIVGFSLTTAAMLLIMLAFTLAFVSISSGLYQRSIAAEIEAGPDVARQAVLEHYASVGLLASRSLAVPEDLQFYAQVPPLDASAPRAMRGGESDAIVPFIYDPADWTPPDAPDSEPGSTGVFVGLRAGWESIVGDVETAPSLTVSFLDADGFTLIAPNRLTRNGRVQLADARGQERVFHRLSADDIAKLVALPAGMPFFAKIDGGGGYRIVLPPDALQFFIPQAGEVPEGQDLDAHLVRSENEQPSPNLEQFRPLGPLVRGRPGRLGQQLVATDAGEFVAVFRFQNVDEPTLIDGGLPIEMRAGVQRSGEVQESSALTVMAARFRNRDTGFVSEPILVYPETNQPLFFSAPGEAVAGGQFDLILENRTPGNIVEFGDFSVAAITDRQPYLFNLFKGFVALWLMSILVTTVGVFASTFVSWPIAIVVSLCVLLSRWAVDQLGDIMQPGFGQKVAGDLFSDGAGAEAAVAENAAEWLNRLTVGFASLLPDLSKFDAATWIEAGQSVPLSVLSESMLVVLVFALPLLVVAYVRLRTKEVAV
ncbi:MAG: ABC transporter permease [Planctomycetota bacterium]